MQVIVVPTCVNVSLKFFKINFLAVITGTLMLWGGRQKEHAIAQEDAWRQTLQFFKKQLSEASSSINFDSQL